MNYFYMDPLYCQQLSFYIRVWALPFSLPLKCFSDLFFIFYIVTPNCFGIQLLATVITWMYNFLILFVLYRSRFESRISGFEFDCTIS